MTVKVAICLAALISCALCVKLPYYNGFIQYGPGKSDQDLASTSNPVEDLFLSVPMKFYGQQYSQICVSDNGFVAFGVRESSNNPQSFPITSGSFILRKTAIAAPCWSNVDLRCGGEVFYREETGSADTDQDLDDIRTLVKDSGLGASSNFNPTSAVIVTYHKVRSEKPTSAECVLQAEHPQNTYQLILTTDEISTYAIFIYDTLEWSVGNGLGPSTSGFNAGNKVDGLNMTPEDHSVYVYQVNLGQSVEVMVKLEAEMMMDYALSSNFGVAETEGYEDLPMFANYEKPLPEPHPAYVPAMTQEAGPCELYPYGPSSGDDDLWGSDTSTGKQYLSKPIFYYGKNENVIVAYINGYITFGSFFTSAFPPKELTKITVPSICPYYADADARGRIDPGRMYWRETTNRLLLNRAKIEINYAFSTNFDPDTLFIVTWDKVGYNHAHDDKQNTFQVVIASSDQIAYVLFLYKNIQWTSPDGCLTPNGDEVTGGLGADSDFLPVMGICDGGLHHQDLLSKPRSQWSDHDYLQLPVKQGSAGLNGMYAFCASTSGSAVSFQKTPYVSSKAQSHAVDPKTSYVLQQAQAQHNIHRPSRPYVSKQWHEDVDALASELGH